MHKSLHKLYKVHKVLHELRKLHELYTLHKLNKLHKLHKLHKPHKPHTNPHKLRNELCASRKLHKSCTPCTVVPPRLRSVVSHVSQVSCRRTTVA